MSFRFKTILGIALIEATLLTILILSGLWYITNSAQREFEHRAESTVNAFSLTAKDAVLSTDIASLESFVNEILLYPGVLYARIRDSEGRTMASAGSSALLERQFQRYETFEQVNDGVLDSYAEIRESGVVFGGIEVGLSVNEIQQVMDKARNYGITIGLFEMLLVALFSFILGGYLTKQLHQLTRASREIAEGNLGYQLEVVGRDEIAETSAAFNTMSRKLADSYEQLQKREIFWRQVINSTLDAIIVIDQKGIIQSFNSGAEEMLGYRVNEVTGSNISMLLPAEHKASHDSYISNYLKTGKATIIGKSRDFEISHRDGTTFPINLRVTEMVSDTDPMFIGVIQDISERKSYEQQLKTSLSEKETLLKEIHHRVKNNLMVVSSLLEMQEEDDPKSNLNRILKMSQERIYSMALIHEKLYHSETLAKVDLRVYLEELLDKIIASYQNSTPSINVIRKLSPIKLNVETATPLGLIVNELVSNCFKHAFHNDETGEIIISCNQSENGMINFRVSDNGCGLPDDLNIENTKSIGLKLVKLLSRQLKADFSFKNEPGCVFSLEFDELEYRKRI